MAEETQKYASYNVLSRNALIFGIPIITLVIFLCLMLATAFIGGSFFGIYGLIVPLLLGCCLFWVKIECQNNSRAMESLWWDFKGWITRVKCRSSITSFTSTNDTLKKRKEKIREWFASHTNN